MSETATCILTTRHRINCESWEQIHWCPFIYFGPNIVSLSNWTGYPFKKIVLETFTRRFQFHKTRQKRVYQTTHSGERISFHDRPLQLLLHKANSSFCVSTYKANISFGSSCLVSMLTDCKIACPHKTSIEYHKSFGSTTFIPGAFYRVIMSMWRCSSVKINDNKEFISK